MTHAELARRMGLWMAIISFSVGFYGLMALVILWCMR